MSKEISNSGGISFLGILTIVFIVLKLCGVISWAWWEVLIPLWAPLVLFGSLAMIVVLWWKK